MTEFGLQCLAAFVFVVVAVLVGLYGWVVYVIRRDLKNIEFEGDNE